MKTIYGTGIIASIALVAGIFGGSFADVLSIEQDQGYSTTEASAFLGHVTIVHTDKDGFVKHYSQGDNLITDEGLNCAPVRLFGEAEADITDCTATALGVFDSVCVFQDVIATEGLTVTSGVAAALTSCLRADGLSFMNPANGTTNTVFVATLTESASGSGSITDIAYRYTGGVGANQAVAAAGLFETDGDAIFAVNDFSGGSITLQESDTLDVTWSITLS